MISLTTLDVRAILTKPVDIPNEVTDALRELGEAGDPLDAVVSSRRMRSALEDWERRLVAEACEKGRSWDVVGRALGLSRQAAWERYRHSEPGRGRSLDGARERQRAQLAEARRIRAAARTTSGAERAELLGRAEELRARALGSLDEVRKETG